MVKLIEIIDRVYEKYLPKIRDFRITFNLDFPDTTLEIEDGARVEKALDENLNSAISRAKDGEIKISVKKGEISISDTGTVLSKTLCEKLSNDHVKIKSRLGFGTKVTIR